MATVGAWARHSVVANFVSAVVGVVGSVTFDLPVAVFPRVICFVQSVVAFGSCGGYWSSVTYTRTGSRQETVQLTFS
jgi:hypothetical protein